MRRSKTYNRNKARAISPVYARKLAMRKQAQENEEAAIRERIENMSDEAVVWLHREAWSEGYTDPCVDDCDSFDEVFDGTAPTRMWEICRDSRDDFSPYDEFFWKDGLGGLISGSASDFVEGYVDIDSLVEFVMKENIDLDEYEGR